MMSLSSTLKDYHSSIMALKKQPYVYSYRIKLFMLKYGLSKSVLKKYVNRSIKKTEKEVKNMNNLSVESILANNRLSKNYFTFLYALCRFLEPRAVVETGVGLGVSSSFILHALQDNGVGELYSIDCPKSTYSSDTGIRIDERAYTQDSMPGFLIPDHLRTYWTLFLGKSEDKLSLLCKQLGTIDLFFHDSEHTYQNMLDEYEIAWPHIRRKGILTSHDIDWNGAFNDFAMKKTCVPPISKNGFGLIIRQ